jgi:hypothetical protein
MMPMTVMPVSDAHVCETAANDAARDHDQRPVL